MEMLWDQHDLFHPVSALRTAVQLYVVVKFIVTRILSQRMITEQGT